MNETIDTRFIADKLNVQQQTIRKWVRDFGIPHHKSGYNKVRYSPDTVAMLERIKELKDNRSSNETIRRLIHVDDDTKKSTTSSESSSNKHSDEDSNFAKDEHNDFQSNSNRYNNDSESKTVQVEKEFMLMVEKKFNHSLSQIENLSIKLSQSERELGMLESDNKHLKADKERLEEEVESIRNQSRIEMKSIQERYGSEVEELKKQLEEERSKGFWTKLFGR